MPGDGRMRIVVMWSGSVALALAIGAMAGRATFVPPRVADAPLPLQTWTVTTETVGRVASYQATVTWARVPLASAAGVGTVTSIAVTPGEELHQGDLLYTIDLRPVVIARGSVPMFRDLERGATGDDVRQLQELLRDLGYLTSPADGRFGAATEQGVRSWQAARGLAESGVIAAGDVVFADVLPARIVLADSVRVGALVQPGSPVLEAVGAAPEVTIGMGNSERGTPPPVGTPVRIATGSGSVQAVVAAVGRDDIGSVTMRLAAPDGGPICSGGCPSFPFSVTPLLYGAEVVLEPDVTGPAVPLAAVGTAADGTQFVVLLDERRVAVTVLARSGARAVVEGVDEGTEVLLIAQEPEAS